MGRKAPRKRLACRVMACRTGVPLSTRTFLGAPPTLPFGVSEATMQNSGAKMRRGKEKGCLKVNKVTNASDAIACPGRGAARNEVERCTADPGPPQTGTVPGLQRIIALCFMLRCARDRHEGPTCGCAK
jgi:hypothetical protein